MSDVTLDFSDFCHKLTPELKNLEERDNLDSGEEEEEEEEVKLETVQHVKFVRCIY